ncbi:hypothetical protein ARMSODRAFT_977807 [Armillaria solidipes]|uniref:Uncharacterized protein n=1 Tax=Armillaria solidipes TaxID=1076256 RepID=A0A2H3BJF3_9AGAR|nr:hypothetical protein ARMSODRAFT_977807 [Armillaria solidipes]
MPITGTIIGVSISSLVGIAFVVIAIGFLIHHWRHHREDKDVFDTSQFRRSAILLDDSFSMSGDSGREGSGQMKKDSDLPRGCVGPHQLTAVRYPYRRRQGFLNDYTNGTQVSKRANVPAVLGKTWSMLDISVTRPSDVGDQLPLQQPAKAHGKYGEGVDDIASNGKARSFKHSVDGVHPAAATWPGNRMVKLIKLPLLEHNPQHDIASRVR